MRRFRFALGIIVWSCAAVAGAQAPPSPLPPPAPQPPNPVVAPSPVPPAAKPAPPVQEEFSYQSDGRRDPFVNLLGTGSEPRQASRLGGEGTTGLLVADISVRGIWQSRGTIVAMVEGPDKKTHLVHQGDRFADGTVKTITLQGLIIVQEVKDPLSLVKQREIRKQLRSIEEAKP
jgi:Tfp pilus assembly protein PilP